ncbi:MAG: ABC transporter ATP-binding protein [Acidimicrobiales bacterium]
MLSSPHYSARRLLGYLRPHRRASVVLLVALLGSTALPLLNPQLLRRFIDQAAAGRPTSALVGTALAYLAVALAGQVVGIGATYLAGLVAWSAANVLREDLVEHVLGLDMAFHGQHTPGELIERVDGDVTALGDVVSKFLFQLLGSGLLLLGAVVAVGREDVRLGIGLAVFLVLVTAMVVRFQQFTLEAATADREADAQLIGNVEERLAGAEEIPALAASAHVLRRFQEASRTAYLAAFRYERRSGLLLAVTNTAFSLGTAGLLVFGVLALRNGTMTIGTVVLLFQYTMLVRQPMRDIVGQFKELQKAGAGAARVLELLNTESSIGEPTEGGALLPDAGPFEVSFRNVSFSYDAEEPVLHGVDLELPAGRSLGLVGRTGSGKSTMARLLLRFYDPVEGEVRIAGHDLRNVVARSRQRRVAIVTQDVQLFGASVRDNLSLFAPQSSIVDDRMVDVLDHLGLGSWLRTLPAGLDTELGPVGSGVSGGEDPLFAFSPVFLANPSLVVLDEATSRLDPATEALIDRAIDELLVGRTAVVIAHRLQSLERVDDIAVVDEGRIIEHGTRADLRDDPTSNFARLLAMSSERVQS